MLLELLQRFDDAYLKLTDRTRDFKQYLNALQDYYTDKNKESADNTYKAIINECKRLLK